MTSHSVLSIFYADPDLYPPVINAVHILHALDVETTIVSRFYPDAVLPTDHALYPESTLITRVHLPQTNSLIQYLYFILVSLHQRNQPADVIIGYDAHGLIAAWLLSVITRKPYIYHCHDFADASEVSTLSQRIIKWLERRIAPNAADVIVPDKERAGVMVEQLKLRRAPLVVANAPLTAPEPSARLQETLAAQGKSFSKIVFRQGRIGPNHALDVTLRSMPLWADPTWGFVIMGPADPIYRDHLNSLAESLGVSDRFVILPAVPYQQVAQFTVGADLGHGLYEFTHFNHIHFTTASNKIMEFLAAGLPVLLPESFGSRSLLTKYGVGVTADVNSPESVATAVNTILGDLARSSTMQAESKRAFEQEFNYAHQYAPVIERLQQLVAARKPRHSDQNR